MKAILSEDPIRKLRVLFVGAFQPPPGSSIRGGQLAACRAILASPLSDHVEWILLDSTMESLPPPPLLRRAWLAALRVSRFLGQLLFSQIDAAMIFTSSELSLVEKGLMTVLAHIMGKRVVLCPRSGYLIREYRRHWFTRWWIRLIINFSDVTVCQGRRWREFFTAVTGLPQARFPIIYNIVEDDSFDSTTPSDRDMATQALLMGWVERNKGVFDLIEVVDRFRPEMSGMKFVICGYGKDWNEVNSELVRRKLEDFFELRGWVNNEGRKQALAESDLCLMLSHHEGMPNALLESMAAGRPVVATSVGAVADIVEEGKNGFLCEPRDIDEIGFRILDLRRSRPLRLRQGVCGRESVKASMGSDVVWRHWLAALQPAKQPASGGNE
ncbi:MAG TPA: glycosyltransferase family 4 protein [Chthoniobacterales bacterium]